MAEGSRPISRPYEGQRVNPVPEGFLSAYAQIGKNYAESGEAIGKGVGMAVAAYVESNKKSALHKGTFQGLMPRVDVAIKRIDKKLAEASPDVQAGALDETVTNDEVIVYRALSRAREDLVSGIGKFEDMSNTKKEQWLGSAASIIKFAEEDIDTEKKDLAAQEAARIAGVKATTEANRELRLKTAADEAQRVKDLPANLSKAFADAITIGKKTGEDLNREKKERERVVASLIAMRANAKTPEELAKVNAQIEQYTRFEDQVTAEAQRTAKFVMEQEASQKVTSVESAQAYLAILQAQRAALLGGAPEILKAYEAGTEGTLSAKALDALPAPVRKELEYIQSDITALNSTIASHQQTAERLKSSDPKKNKALADTFTFVPPSATGRSQAIVRRERARNAYIANTSAYGYSPTDQELEWVADLAEYDGAVTDDGFRISIDAKTGRIDAKQDEQWVALFKKNPLYFSDEERQQSQKRQAELNQIAYQADRRTFGTKQPNGQQRARRWIYDPVLGVNHVYVRGTAKLDATQTEKVHELVADTSVEMSSLSSIISGIAKRDEKGQIIYQKGTDGKDITVRGVRIPEVKSSSEMTTADRKALAIGVSNFIRIRAKSLGVLSAQDWSYLDTLIPGVSAQFATNIKAGQSASSLLPKILDYVITNITTTTKEIVPNAVILAADARTNTISKLKNIQAEGTSTGFLEVTGGLAKLEDGSSIIGDPLDRWYDITLTTDFDSQNERNEIAEAHAKLKILYEMRNGTEDTKKAFMDGRDAFKAFLYSRGMDEEQVNQIIKNYFASEF